MFCVFIRNRPTILPRNSPFSQTEKLSLDGCADNTSYNQIIRFIKYKNRHMRNYENARLDLELDPHPLSKLQGIELTKDLYA